MADEESCYAKQAKELLKQKYSPQLHIECNELLHHLRRGSRRRTYSYLRWDVYDPGIHTYCVCLFPSYELNFVYTDVTREITEEENSMICEAERESSCYADVYWIGKMPYTEIEADNIDEAIEELNANWRDVPENGHYDVFGKLVI